MELGSDDEGRRLDRVLRKALKSLPLSAIHRALRKGEIRVNGQKRAPDYRCRQGERIEGKILISGEVKSTLSNADPTTTHVEASNPLWIVHEDDSLLFLNKPLGQLVHGSTRSLEASVRSYLEGKLPPSVSFVPGPLHRLDRNTSGLLCFSKSLEGAIRFSTALREGKIGKTYIALLEGRLEGRHRWDDMLLRSDGRKSQVVDRNGSGYSSAKAKAASMDIVPLAVQKNLSLAAIRLHSGRTHQIRVQSAYHGFPLAGDVKYGAGRRAFPYLLHAFRLSFSQTLYSGLPQSLEAPIHKEFLEIIENTFPFAAEEVYSIVRKSIFQEAD